MWLSAPQFRTAQTEGSRFTLAVVERAYEAEATIHFIDDPASRIDRFCFDYGWAAGAQRSVTVLGALEPERPTAAGNNGSVIETLIRAIVEAGLPEPEMPWTLGDTELAAAWIDVRVGIAPAALPSSAMPHGWLVRPAAEWSIESLLDAVRDGQ